MAAELFSVEDINRTLHNTVCLFDGSPVRVVCDPNTGILNLYNLETGRETRVPHTDPRFNYDAPRLGYYFDGHYCGYLKRRPGRQWRAGIGPGVVDGSRFLRPNWLYSPAMSKCILGEHMSFQQAFDLVTSNKEITKVPFHRHFAIAIERKRIALLYRDEIIGYWDRTIRAFRSLPECGASVIINYLRKSNVENILV